MLSAFTEKVNPASHWYLTEDKIAFHHHCIKNNLSVPELVAVLTQMANPIGRMGRALRPKIICWMDWLVILLTLL